MHARRRRPRRRKRYHRRRPGQSDPRLLLLLFFGGFAVGSILYLLGGQLIARAPLDRPPARMGDEIFAIDLGYEVERDVAGSYRLDAQLPQIISGYPSADQINSEIASDFWYVREPTAANLAQAFSGWPQPQITIRYAVAQQGDVYTITITLQLESAYMREKQTLTYRYQYDVKKQARILSDTPLPQISTGT